MTLSITSILKKIYAASAMRSYMSQSKPDMPPLLTPDNTAALKSLIIDSISFAVIELVPHFAGCDVDKNIENVELTLSTSLTPQLPLLNALESAVAARTLSLVFADFDPAFSTAQDTAASVTLTSIARVLNSCSAAEAKRVLPHYY